MKAREFEACVEAAIAALPEQFRRVVNEVPIIIEDEALPEHFEGLEEPIGDDELLGLYAGASMEEAELMGAEPARIYLFRGPLERACGNRRELEKEIRITLLHEIGHYLGLEEEDLERLGYE